MAIKMKLTGDLGQRFVVRKQVGTFDWVDVGWADTQTEADGIVRHFKTDTDTIDIKVIDRQGRLL